MGVNQGGVEVRGKFMFRVSMFHAHTVLNQSLFEPPAASLARKIH